MSIQDLISKRTEDYVEKQCIGFSPDQIQTVDDLVTELKDYRSKGDEFAPGKATGRVKEIKSQQTAE